MSVNASLVNFAAGETSPKSRGRFDTNWFSSSCRKLVNFIAEIAGPARFRPGFKVAGASRRNAVARYIPFRLNNVASYMLEFTSGYMRVFVDGSLKTTERATITAITNANPAVITVSTISGISDDSDVLITGIVGMTELNGRQVRVTNRSGLTYELVDAITGTDIDSTTWGAYSSGGTLYSIYEIQTPYLEDELNGLSIAQNGTTMYVAHPNHPPRKLTVNAAEDFTLSEYTRTNDPLTAGDTLTISSAFQPTPFPGKVGVIFGGSGAVDSTVTYTISGMAGAGAASYNGLEVKIVRLAFFQPGFGWVSFNVLTLASTGAYVAYAGAATGGQAASDVEHPLAVTFYEGRQFFLGTNVRPNIVIGSRAPDDDGNNRFDDFTGGTDADHAVFFALAPVNGVVDYIMWGAGTSEFLAVGTFGGTFRISGGGLEEPITPTSINVKQLDAYGCAQLPPASGPRVAFIQRGGKTVRTIAYDSGTAAYATKDMCLNAEHIGAEGLTALAFQAGRPDVMWVVRGDGQLAAVTVHGDENIAGWHRHILGGTDAKVLSVAVLPDADETDQVWVAVERTVDGVIRRTAEYLTEEVVFPDREDFFTSDSAEDDDKESFWNALYRKQEEYVHLDAAATYDGSNRGASAEATLTPGATTGDSVTFTASASVFATTDVGNELWKKPSAATGVGSGRAVITAFVSATEVTCDIEADFDSTDAIPAGEWHIAVETISGIHHLEGARVAVVTDGAVYSDGETDEYPTVEVQNGEITLADPAAVVHVGLPYKGLLHTQNIEAGGRTGPAQAKPRNIAEMAIRFLNSLGCEYGTDRYKMEKIVHYSTDNITDRPNPVFSGIRRLPYSDTWNFEGEKSVIVTQSLPLPATVQFVDVSYDIGDEG